MEENYDSFAVTISTVFGAIIVGGLMAAALVYGERDAFFFALGAATAAWLAGYAIFFDRPRTFMALVGIAVLMSLGATIILAF
ncbi:hypothetical protein NYR54_01640 [Chelativorans sp. SCAU2101]|jgi:hypothetical protein|uniref:Uncharacterized protein n=1 Tax=Chelativorans petroleitrophicus TaxID=2975484 RepID=A0A9X3AZ07_9HYPH|nr:hypothetical protein [Chelativorans petroleitrophicus]MCT8988999.1 hypothetical protein [Chelativorans petroleitrophicus]